MLKSIIKSVSIAHAIVIGLDNTFNQTKRNQMGRQKGITKTIDGTDYYIERQARWESSPSGKAKFCVYIVRPNEKIWLEPTKHLILEIKNANTYSHALVELQTFLCYENLLKHGDTNKIPKHLAAFVGLISLRWKILERMFEEKKKNIKAGL
jgi:hypothetical protein